ncbi:maltokinase N-terminal cap-like domain-containing protein [Nocardia goodfellowii]|uniref:Maltokinase N-terminal cap domain-containing protein n=1 Tax=Nocardia goodfellowii TaxID=882446 RepID=A0ABS4QA44_9NOCA|nr:1,4-alpha-glucan branching protein [Nocardia goodfellowii]MBP2188443.1 hypothetical protein [Nocardia goodfellowii]
MAVVHNTTMEPTKLELLAHWLPQQRWYHGAGAPVLRKAGGFRLDDPAGEVGIEFMIVIDETADPVAAYHVPMTYRGEPVAGAEAALIGTSEHGVLGTRWIYDGAADEVLLEQAAALLTGKAQAQAQNASDAIDPTVEVATAPDRPLTVRVNRTPRDQRPAAALGYVTAPWQAGDVTARGVLLEAVA